MEPSAYEVMFQQEERHWWYVGMRALSFALLREHWEPTPERRILDAGCGSGAMLERLASLGRAVGVDIAREALCHAQRRPRGEWYQASIERLPFADVTFHLVTSFDVLYHLAVGDDMAALRELWRVLVPEGRLLLRVPAFEALRGQHDRWVHTRHRYTAGELRTKLEETGFQILRLTYANAFLLPLALLERLVERVMPAPLRNGQLQMASLGPFDVLLERVLAAEAKVLRRQDLPLGLSLFCVARKGRPEAS